MTFRPRFGTTKSQQVYQHHGPANRKKKKVKHVRVAKPKAPVQRPGTDNLFSHAGNSIGEARSDRSSSSTRSSETASDQVNDPDSNESEWYNIEATLAEEDISQILEGMRLEEPSGVVEENPDHERPNPIPAMDWTNKATTKKQRDDSWEERQNWLHQLSGIAKVILTHEVERDGSCCVRNCPFEGTWNCLDCDIGISVNSPLFRH